MATTLLLAEVLRRLLSIEEYERMGAAGILDEDERVELIDGVLVQMAAVGDRHVACVIRLTDWFGMHAAGRAFVSVQNPIRLPPRTEPEPDLVLVRRRTDTYRGGVPGPDDTLLVIEVSDTTLAYDRDVKVPRYAAAGIPETWVIDLTGERVLVYRQPGADGYEQLTTLTRGGALSPAAFPELALRVDDVLG